MVVPDSKILWSLSKFVNWVFVIHIINYESANIQMTILGCIMKWRISQIIGRVFVFNTDVNEANRPIAARIL